MSTQRRSVLKNWFRKGLTPTQEQFADAFDSFFHRSEDLIPLNNVEGLTAAIETKKAELQEYINERLRASIDDLDGRVNDNSEMTVSDISFVSDNGGFGLEVTMLSGNTTRVPLSIPSATEDNAGLMSASDKSKLERLSESFIDLAEYMNQDDELPAGGVYLYEGYPVDSRIYSMSDGGTYWLVFCLKKGDTNNDDFGIGVKDCLVYQADSRSDSFYFVGRYYGAAIPSHVQKAFGYVLASSDNAGLMSAADKEKLDDIDDELEAIKLSDNAHHPSRFGAIVEGNITFETVGLVGIPSTSTVVWCKDMNCFALRTGNGLTTKYYNSWPRQDEYTDIDTADPYTDKQYICGNRVYMYDSSNTKLIEVGGSSASSIFNATNEVPINGYYVLCDQQNTGLSAVHAAWNSEKAVSGLIISFEIAAGVWKTYQYIGRTLTEQNWLNTDNWQDFGSLAAGSETYININSLIGAPIAGAYYTLETAVARLVAWQQTSGVTYIKKGLIISYQTGENTLETKQFQGEVTDFGEVGLWKDFGGGSEVETSDEPEEGGKDAFSTGGAYERIPFGIKVDTETEGFVKLQLENAAGDGIGDEMLFPVGTGGGGSSDAYTVMLNMQETPAEIQKDTDVSINIKGTSTVTYAIGGTEAVDEDLTVEIQTRTNTTAAWTTRGTVTIRANSNAWMAVSLKAYLTGGTNYVRLRAVGMYSASIWRSFSVNVVNLSLTPNSPLEFPMEDETLSLNYLVGGAVAKTLQMELGTGSGSDFVAVYSYTNNDPGCSRSLGTSTNTTTGMTFEFTDATMLATLLSGGVHTVRARLYVSDTVSTPWVESQYIVADGSNKMVSVNNVGTTFDNWSEVHFFDWAAYCGDDEQMTVVFRLTNESDTTEYASWTFTAENERMYSLAVQLGIELADEDTTEFYGYMHIEDGEGNTLAPALFMTFANAADNRPTKGADFIMNPSDRNNSEDHPDTIVNAANGNTVSSVFDGFNFVTDGWMAVKKDLDTQAANAETVRAFHVPANRSVAIGYNPFAQFTDGNNTGRSVTMEIDFRTYAITDETEPVLRIGTVEDDGKVWGFEMLPLEAYMLTQRMRAVDDQNVSWAEEVRTRLTVNVVYNLGGLNLVRIFINDKIEREFIYTTNDRFTATGDITIAIGSTSSDIDIFGIRCYKKALSTAEVMQDYKAAMTTASEKVAFNEANDILDDNGNISWTKCEGKYNIIGHTGHLPKYGDENKGKTKGVSIIIKQVDDAAHSGTLTNLDASGQGTTAMTYYDWNQQYKITDNSVFTPDEGTAGEAGAGYALQEGEALAKKLVGKINFASSMQSHKLGLTWIYNDLYDQLVTNGVITKPSQKTLYPNARIAVLEKPFLFFHRETENDPWTFKYLMTFGAGKGDKPTFGFNKNTTGDMLMVEGANNDRPLALFRIPWNDDITYSPDDEAWMYDGQKQLNFGFGKTTEVGGKEYPSSTNAIAAQKAFFNHVYLHYSRLNIFTGTLSQLRRSEDVDITKLYWVTQGDETLGSSQYDLYRYDPLTQQWVDAGIEKLGEGSYEKLNLRTQYEAFCQDVGVSPATWTAGQWTAINASAVAMRRRHFHETASDHIHVDDALFHSCFVKLYAGTDNRAKNTYYYTDPDTLKIRHEQDDVDTTIKTNNVGQNRKPYYVEEHDANAAGDYYWQGEESGYYNLLEEAFETEMTTMMNNMFTAMAQLGGTVMGFHERYFLSTQDYFPGIAYNEQARLVYEAAAVAQAAGIYKNDSAQAITQSCGSQRWSEYQWLRDRIMYISSWCEYGEFAGSSTASGGMSWRGKAGATYRFQLTPAKWMYPRVGSDSGNYPASTNGRVRVAAGQTFSYRDITLSSDSWIAIRGIDYYSRLGDMNIGLSSDQGTFSFSGKRLRAITINPDGMDANQFLATRVEISNAVNIEEFTMRGVTTVTGAIDLTKCTRLKTIDLRGCTFNTIGLAEGTPLTTVRLNATLTELAMSQMSTLQTLTVEGVGSMRTLVLNSLGAIGRSIVEQCYNSSAPLTTLTLTDVGWQSVSRELLMWLVSLPSCTLTGNIRLLASVQLTLDDVLTLYERFGDIQDVNGSLYIDYTKVFIQHIGIKGQKYFKALGTTQFSIATDVGNNIAFVNGKPALTWQFVTTEGGGQEVEDPDAAEFIRLTDTALGTAEVIKLNGVGDETRYRLKVTALLTTGESVSNYWRVGMYDRLPRRGDFAYADGTFDDDFHYAKTVVGYALRVTSGVDALTIDVSAKEGAYITSTNTELNTASLPWGIYQSSDSNGFDETTCNAISAQSGNITLRGFATIGSGTSDYASQTKTLAMTDRAKTIIRGWLANLWTSVDLTAPTFSEEATYAVGETVTYEGVAYLCKTAVTEAGAFDSSEWTALTTAKLSLMRQVQQWANESKLPASSNELGDMMLALNYLETAFGTTTPVRFYQLFYPAAYACQVYVPTVKDGETLDAQYARGSWLLPAAGMLYKTYLYYHASRGKETSGTVSADYANEDETLADADYPLMANMLKRLTDAGANTANYPMPHSDAWPSSSEAANTLEAVSVIAWNNQLGYIRKYMASQVGVRAVVEFTYQIEN